MIQSLLIVVEENMLLPLFLFIRTHALEWLALKPIPIYMDLQRLKRRGSLVALKVSISLEALLQEWPRSFLL